MKYNTKGFTLIELLAVIVILAIIALITTPIILNVIENSRLGAAKDKAYGTIEAVKVAYAQAQTTQEVQLPYTISYDSSATSSATLGLKAIGTTSVTISGDSPTSGTITIDNTYKISVKNLQFGKYYCNGDDTTTAATAMKCSTTKVS